MLVFAASLGAANAGAETYRLDYEAAVLSVVVLGTASYEVTADPTRYAVRANLRTSGLARLFDQTEITATAGGCGVRRRHRLVALRHFACLCRQVPPQAGGVTAQVRPSYGDMGSPPASAAQQAGSYDPLTGQIGVARARHGSVLVFDGRQHYRLSVSLGAQRTFSGGGYNGPALQCQLRYIPIAGFGANFDRSRLPVAEAWFALPAQPGFAPPVRLSAPTPLGTAQLDLRGYERLA